MNGNFTDKKLSKADNKRGGFEEDEREERGI